MSEHWQKLKLGDICELKYGEGLPKRARVKGEFPVYGSSGIVDYHNNYLVEGPGIIVGRKGSIGSVYFEKRNFFPIDTVFYIVDNKESYNIRFLYYVLSSLKLSRLNTDAAVPGLNRNVAYQQYILLSTLNIQNKIASILSAYDDLIENNNRRIKILEGMAQTIYNEWFVKFRFPAHSKVKMVDSELGKIPEMWGSLTLGDIAQRVTEHFVEVEHSELPLLDLARIPRTSLVISDYGKSDEIKTARIIFKKQDILFGAIRPYFHKVIFAMGDGITNTSVFVIRPKEVELLFYLFLLLFSKYTIDWATTHSGGTKMPVIAWDVFIKMKIIVPSKDVLKEFNAFMEDMFEEICILNLKNQNLKLSRDLLLPKLISSEIDIEHLDIKTEDTE